MIIASDPFEAMHSVVDNGHCMRHVQVCHGVPHSSALRRGAPVGPDTPHGAIIATFSDGGRYTNSLDGSSTSRCS